MKPKPFGQHTLYGSTTVGARGQVVIPIKARRDLKLKAGEEMLVAGAHGRFLMIMKISEMKGIMEELAERISEFKKLASTAKK
ncbi:MAG: hypothetical protein HY220_02845 [Candidatus Sungbacteria bacterium]|uniref:AbrB family transcriptional regulator n=1 Tax=Candidatus Sungiibacteriota bacterium TaxID=2750080 RepID=A0A9D6LQ31_9BACT|nr:hypothetical protein [Candidatus Sungbacteria bacterium]